MEQTMQSGKLHKRGLTSFFTLFGFLIMSITGLVLYVEPVGRVAYWTNWQMLGLSKTDWGNIHILSSLLFVVAGVFHTLLNWKPLLNYFRDRITRGIKLGREMAIASVVALWVIVASIFPHPPLSYLLDFNAYLKDVWVVEKHYEPPFGHAELLPLKSFASKMKIDLPAAMAELRAQGLRFDSADQTIEEIAAANEISPMDLYLLIKKFEPAQEQKSPSAEASG